MAVYLKLFHGRDTHDEEMDDWGYEGPVIGPVDYIHTTYGMEVKWFADGQDQHAVLVNNLFPYEGKFYGDWAVTSFDPREDKP